MLNLKKISAMMNLIIEKFLYKGFKAAKFFLNQSIVAYCFFYYFFFPSPPECIWQLKTLERAHTIQVIGSEQSNAFSLLFVVFNILNIRNNDIRQLLLHVNTHMFGKKMNKERRERKRIKRSSCISMPLTN